MGVAGMSFYVITRELVSDEDDEWQSTYIKWFGMEKISKSTALLQQALDVTHTPGIAATVFKDGKMVYSGAVGYGDVENLIKMTPDSVIRIGSIAKSITGIALGILVEQGKLDLDAPISKYLPDDWLPKNGPNASQITTRQLASHFSGIRSYKGNEFQAIRDHHPTVDTALKVFQADPLESPPGTKFLYSTHAYTLLGAIIESISGQHFLDFVDENISRSLNLKSLQGDYNGLIVPGRVRYYYSVKVKEEPSPNSASTLQSNSNPPDSSFSKTSSTTSSSTPQLLGKNHSKLQSVMDGDAGDHQSTKSLRNCLDVDNSWKWAGGGFLASARDLGIFGNAILYNRLISDKTKQLLWTPHEGGEYGIGFRITKSDETLHVSHTGSAIGASTCLLLVPEENLCVSVVGNLQDMRYSKLSKELAEVWSTKAPKKVKSSEQLPKEMPEPAPVAVVQEAIGLNSTIQSKL